MEHARLREIWLDHRDPKRETYPPEYHPYFLRLMEKFDICYRLEAEDRSLVAQLVPVERPQLPWQSDSELRPNQRELALFCKMEEDPPGLVAWLTVRNRRFSTGRHWRRGIFLEHQGHQALLQMNGQLFVSVRGTSPDYFFSLVRDSLEYLIQIRWPGLKYAFQMPCPHREEDGRRCDGRFEFTNLLRARERGIPAVQCNTCFDTWSVSLLLTGFAPSADPISVKLEEFKSLLRESWQDQAHMLRMVMKAINAENRDSPRLFSLFPLEQHRWDPRRLGQVQYKLHLWYEQPEHQHPAEDGQYIITQSREWLVKMAPYASFVAKVLKLAVPLAGAVSDMALDEATAKAVQPEFKFMEKLTSELRREELEVPRQVGESRSGLNEAQGSGLRELQSLLLELDPPRKWGDLRCVQNAAGDYLWVCPGHYREYDPGLPVLPRS